MQKFLLSSLTISNQKSQVTNPKEHQFLQFDQFILCSNTALFLLFIHVLGPQHKDCFWFYRYMSANNNLDSSFSPWWQVLSNFWTIHFCLGTLHYQVLSQISFLTAFSIWKTNLRYFLLSVLVRRVFFFWCKPNLISMLFDISILYVYHSMCAAFYLYFCSTYLNCLQTFWYWNLVFAIFWKLKIHWV